MPAFFAYQTYLSIDSFVYSLGMIFGKGDKGWHGKARLIGT